MSSTFGVWKGASTRRTRASIFRATDAPRSSGALQNMGVKSAREAGFVFGVGVLLSLNSGYINGLCLGGLLAEGGSVRQGVSAFTGTYTHSGLALAGGDPRRFGFEIGLVLAFIAGAAVSGAMNPRPTPHMLAPSYGPCFLVGSLCMVAAAAMAEAQPGGRGLYYFAAAACGVQNGMTSMYSGNLIRTTHLTGTSTDIGLIVGQMLRGNWKNFWKFKVLLGLVISFWLGGLVSFYAASALLSRALWLSAALFLAIGLTHVLFVIATEKVSFFQACVGAWEWDRVLEDMAKAMTDKGGDLTLLAQFPEKVDAVFDQIDGDGSGEIDAEELGEALRKMGFKLTAQNVKAMIAAVDDNGDGVVDRAEFHVLVAMATARAQRRSGSTRGAVSQAGAAGPAPCPPARDGDDEEQGPAAAAPVVRRRLPRTYGEALGPGAEDGRAVIVTEPRHPYAIVGVNEPWEDLCGYRASEAVGKSMGGLIQGPKTNREGLKRAVDELARGAHRVECTTVNYRKDMATFNNSLEMGPLYDTGDDGEVNEDVVAYYVGILTNIGELAQDMIGVEEKKEEIRGDESA